MNYDLLMRKAIEISAPYKYLVKPNPMVGALIVKDGKILKLGNGFWGLLHGALCMSKVAQYTYVKNFKRQSDCAQFAAHLFRGLMEGPLPNPTRMADFIPSLVHTHTHTHTDSSGYTSYINQSNHVTLSATNRSHRCHRKCRCS